MARYLWKPNTPINLDAQTVGETLESIRVTNGGMLEPQAVVEASRPPSAPLHEYFVWDDAVAAERYRKDQAGHLITCITVEVARGAGQEPATPRAFVSVVQGDSRHYTSMHVAMGNPDLRKQVVQTAMRELRAFRERYKAYVELSKVFEAIDRLGSQQEAA